MTISSFIFILSILEYFTIWIAKTRFWLVRFITTYWFFFHLYLSFGSWWGWGNQSSPTFLPIPLGYLGHNRNLYPTLSLCSYWDLHPVLAITHNSSVATCWLGYSSPPLNRYIILKTGHQQAYLLFNVPQI